MTELPLPESRKRSEFDCYRENRRNRVKSSSGICHCPVCQGKGVDSDNRICPFCDEGFILKEDLGWVRLAVEVCRAGDDEDDVMN
ncbi:MAG: hypothetical protein D6820_13175 [Lentisphaerae bacterium]|nr:MAG: hypothetical protein D6820_13175 [Lentisphaerota bacterium]